MDIFTELETAAGRLRSALGGAVTAAELPSRVRSLDGSALDEVVAAASDLDPPPRRFRPAA